jgi:phage baseplate assembly protein W
MAVTPNTSKVNENAYYDAQGINFSNRSNIVYRDVSLNFSKHPITGDITKLSDAESVKASVRNLINTNFGERPFHPEIGSDIRATLFEPVSPIVASLLARHVEDVINNFEPRAELSNVICIGDIDQNRYEVSIEFYMRNSSEDLQTLDVFLERLR